LYLIPRFEKDFIPPRLIFFRANMILHFYKYDRISFFFIIDVIFCANGIIGKVELEKQWRISSFHVNPIF